MSRERREGKKKAYSDHDGWVNKAVEASLEIWAKWRGLLYLSCLDVFGWRGDGPEKARPKKAGGVSRGSLVLKACCLCAAKKGVEDVCFLPFPKYFSLLIALPMDNRPNNAHELFSRASTPPAQGPAFTPQAQPVPIPQQQQPANASSSDLIDSLFHHIISPQEHPAQLPAGPDASQPNPDNYQVVSAPISPALPLTDEPISSSASAPSSSSQTQAAAQERHNALLSLLNNPQPPAPSTSRPAPAPGPSGSQHPQQVPTPPGSSRSNASPALSQQTENQKILLEQLMGR